MQLKNTWKIKNGKMRKTMITNVFIGNYQRKRKTQEKTQLENKWKNKKMFSLSPPSPPLLHSGKKGNMFFEETVSLCGPTPPRETAGWLRAQVYENKIIEYLLTSWKVNSGGGGRFKNKLIVTMASLPHRKKRGLCGPRLSRGTAGRSQAQVSENKIISHILLTSGKVNGGGGVRFNNKLTVTVLPPPSLHRENSGSGPSGSGLALPSWGWGWPFPLLEWG